MESDPDKSLVDGRRTCLPLATLLDQLFPFPSVLLPACPLPPFLCAADEPESVIIFGRGRSLLLDVADR